MLMIQMVDSKFRMPIILVKGMNLKVKYSSFELSYKAVLLFDILSLNFKFIELKLFQSKQMLCYQALKIKILLILINVSMSFTLIIQFIQFVSIRNLQYQILSNMISPNDHQFEFREQNMLYNKRNNENNKNNHNIQKKKDQADNKMIICENANIGINIQDHLNKIQNFYEQKILKQSIKKAVIGTFERKNLLKEGQFQIEKAQQDSINLSKAYVDKIETWLGDSIINSPALRQFEAFKQKKMKERTAKINSIMKLIQKIANKVQDKKLQSIKKQFEASLETKIVKIPENKQYTKAVYKMKFIKERVAANKKQLENKRQQSHF